jgi:hypothetical protein
MIFKIFVFSAVFHCLAVPGNAVQPVSCSCFCMEIPALAATAHTEAFGAAADTKTFEATREKLMPDALLQDAPLQLLTGETPHSRFKAPKLFTVFSDQIVLNGPVMLRPNFYTLFINKLNIF